jgi:cbb3-type cytochrome oxidase subunit 3
MFQEFLAESRFLGLPLAATILFFLVFAAVIVTILRGVFKRKSYDHVASLPLQDDAPDPVDSESEEDTRS